MTSPDRITVSRSKRGTTIKATGRSAQALFDALTAEPTKPTPEHVAGHVVAWCWATGLIEIGYRVPDGAIEIVRGPDAAVRAEMDVAARHGYEGALLVPGIPEAKGQKAKGDALGAWIKWRADCKSPKPALTWNAAALAE